MVIRSGFFLVVILIVHSTVVGNNVRQFLGRVIGFQDQQPVKNVGVRCVNITEGRTNSDGVFEFAIPSETTQITVHVNDPNLQIIFPANGILHVPQDPQAITTIYVGQPARDYLKRALARSDKELQNSLKDLGISQDEVSKSLTMLRQEIYELTNIRVEDYRSELDLVEKRASFYPVFSTEINNYINEAKDLRDAFRFIANHAFDDGQALLLLSAEVSNYNNAYESLNKNRHQFEKKVGDYWDNEARKIEASEFLNYVLGEVHSTTIFIYNLKLQEINEYNSGQLDNRKRRQLKEKVINDLKTLDLTLDRKLLELDARSRVLLTRLNN